MLGTVLGSSQWHIAFVFEHNELRGEFESLLLSLLTTNGNVADCRAADGLRDDHAPRTIVLADEAYDNSAIRDLIERQGAVSNIPSKANRPWKICFWRSPTKAETPSSAGSAA